MTTSHKNPGVARCRLFGTFWIEGPGGVVRIRSRRARALIAYLAFAGAAGASRERLSGLLWSDRGEEQARGSLRQCLLELRRELAEASADILEVTREMVAIRPGALASDWGDLDEAIRGHDSAALIECLQAIGPNMLLEDLSRGGLFDEWLLRMRAQVDSAIEREVRRTIEAAEESRAWEELRRLAEAFLLRSPTDEMVAAAAIRADMALGVTSAAHRRFRALETTLANELGVRPGSTVRGALASVPDPVAQPRPAPAAPELKPPSEESPPLVIVGSFHGLETGESAEAVAEAVRDEVVSGLSRFRDLRVVTHPHAASTVDAEAFADPHLVFTLGARTRTGARPGITIQLVRLNTGAIVWSDTFAIPEGEILSATDRIVARVVGAILPSIDLDLVRPRHQDGGDGSYLRHLRARNRALHAETYEEALAAEAELEALIAAHPGFVPPYLSLAYLYNTDFNYTLAFSSDEAKQARALSLAKTAMSVDRGHIHGYTVAAWCYLRARQWEPALRLFEQAFSLNPFNANRLKEVGFGLLFLDERDRARELLDRCLLVNPTPEDGFFSDLGLLELVCGNHERASTYFELVAAPSIWSMVYQALNAELAGVGAPGVAQRARQRIASIWPAGVAMTPEAVLGWVISHHPFKSKAVEERFISGARVMLDSASIPTPLASTAQR